MVSLGPVQAIKDQQKELLNLLETKHKDLKMWLDSHGINPLDLKVYSASIAAALSVTLAAGTETEAQVSTLAPVIQEVSVAELQGLAEEEKAALIWERYRTIIKRSAEKYNIDQKLIFATIMVESNGNTRAIRYEPHIGDASYGLGQILYGTAKGIGFQGSPEELFDPEVNIELIARYHARNKAVYGDLTNEQLVTAYNAGSPYSTPLPGHLTKFRNWFEKIEGFRG